jgi:hypothetical protein
MSDLKVPTKIESDRPGAAQHQPALCEALTGSGDLASEASMSPTGERLMQGAPESAKVTT